MPNCLASVLVLSAVSAAARDCGAMPATMQAVSVANFGGPETLAVKEIPLPIPGHGQALVKILAAGVNPVETYIRSGTYARKPPLPWTPGNDGAGTIEALGPDTGGLKGGLQSFSVGDRVWLSGAFSGTYAQFALCDAAQLHPLPDRLTFEQGAAIGVAYRTAHRALFVKSDACPSTP